MRLSRKSIIHRNARVAAVQGGQHRRQLAVSLVPFNECPAVDLEDDGEGTLAVVRQVNVEHLSTRRGSMREVEQFSANISRVRRHSWTVCLP